MFGMADGHMATQMDVPPAGINSHPKVPLDAEHATAHRPCARALCSELPGDAQRMTAYHLVRRNGARLGPLGRTTDASWSSSPPAPKRRHQSGSIFDEAATTLSAQLHMHPTSSSCMKPSLRVG